MNDRNQILQAIAKAEAEVARLNHERDTAIHKLNALQSSLENINAPPSSLTEKSEAKSAPITKFSPSSEKVRLFAELFRGRDDVFARLWESKKTGKRGYSPACEYEWQAGICTKPEKKCTACKYSLLTEEVLRQHLSGQHTVGVYPLRQDETCCFLAIDLDKQNWQDDAAAFLEVCRSMNVPAALERSRSGNGGHVWIFFNEPIPALVARNMGSYLITETMSRHHQLSMASYDRMFPNQDTMPKGGFGNLIALPLQKQARKSGNTEFLDERFQPYPDQWAFLASVRKMTFKEVEALAHEAIKNNRITGIAISSPEEVSTPWQTRRANENRLLQLREQLPARLKIVLADRLYIEKHDLPSALLAEIKRLASFQNPKFYEAQRLRLSTSRIPRIISCTDELPRHLAIPRGCQEKLGELLELLGVALEVSDDRLYGNHLEIHFQGILNENQREAVEKLLQHDCGVFVAPPGSGKTIVGISLLTQRKCSTLILVHRKPLVQQWRNHLTEFLNLDSQEIGIIGGGQNSPTGKIDVAMLPSLIRKGEVNPLIGNYGHIIVDECHHIPAFSFEQVLKQARARYVIGLTATPYRHDGHHPIIYMQCGPIRHEIAQQYAQTLGFLRRRLISRETDLHLPEEEQKTIHEIYRAVVMNEARNQCIVGDVSKALEENRSPIILTERREHLEILRAKLEKSVQHLIVLHGGLSAKEHGEIQQQLAAIPPNEQRVILATGSFIGEGFDDSRLDTLFLAMPVSFKGKLHQYVGRILRPNVDKLEVRVYDYVDKKVPMLERMFKKRMRAYRTIGFEEENLKVKKQALVKAGITRSLEQSVAC